MAVNIEPIGFANAESPQSLNLDIERELTLRPVILHLETED